MQMASECNAYIQREARTRDAKKRSAAGKIAIERFRAADPKRWKKYRSACDERRNSRRRESRQGVSTAQLQAADQATKAMLTAPAFVCAYCGKSVPPGPSRTVDHIKPRSAGGKHVVANLAPACRSCNSRKNARTRYPHPLTPPLPIAGP